MIPAHFLVDTGKSNEKKALLEMLKAGVTYIADRGYLSFPLLAAITAAKAFFIVRAKVNLVYQRVERLPVTLPDTVRHIFLHVTDQRVRLTNAKGKPIYRLVSFYVGREQYLILTNRMWVITKEALIDKDRYQLYNLSNGVAYNNNLKVLGDERHFALRIPKDKWAGAQSEEGDYVMMKRELQMTQPGVEGVL